MYVESIFGNEFLHRIEAIRSLAHQEINRSKQVEFGQFFTPIETANLMASMFTNSPESVHLLDPGAGIGVLTAAYINQIVQFFPKTIDVTVYELDSTLFPGLQSTLTECGSYCQRNKISFHSEIKQEDFIESISEKLGSRNSFFPIETPNFNAIIMNPPYRKINSNSKERKQLSSIGIETTNLYSAFLWLATKVLSENGELVAIIPRSFCNGSYYKNFRVDFLRTMSIQRIHIFESRKKTFQEDDVLQENIIIHATKGTDKPEFVTISSSSGPDGEDLQFHQVRYENLVYPDDTDQYIRIISDQIGQQFEEKMKTFFTTLQDLNLSVSTGRVVDFRADEYLSTAPEDAETIPLIYPNSFQNGYVNWPPRRGKKPVVLLPKPGIEQLVIPSDVYVLVRRFSAKEEKRRVSAVVYDPDRVKVDRIGIENHINYFHRTYGGLSLILAKGLALYLNSTFFDQYFRQLSGHTQVNATDLRNVRYPTSQQLHNLGMRIGDEFPDQETIDAIVGEELNLTTKSSESNISNPIQVKKRIGEALSILQELNVPRAQQNERSALSLLALVNLKPEIPWSEAEVTQFGITEMMDFFREYYGKNYAPNTRETVRRQTIHQFMQLGFVLANLDDPKRPINSPKTKYQIEESALELLRTYGSREWGLKLSVYLKSTPTLATLQVREREMLLIPVTLPNGQEINLSAGGQNDLIKKIVEEFCPRYTPGGNVIYVGDAGNKLSENERKYFEQLGINIDPHGKMPDVVVDFQEKNWLVLIEAVTSHGPIDNNRHNELKELFKSSKKGLVFLTAFETRRALNRFLKDIAWETEVWVAEAPSHVIHFNGERFLGPYPD